MSLIVYFLAVDNSIDKKEFEKEIQPPHNSLFGFESWRKLVWGDPKIKDMGCKLIYKLGETAVIEAFNDDLNILKNDLDLILYNIRLIVGDSDAYKDDIEFRVKNALEYVRIAMKYPDKIGVSIG